MSGRASPPSTRHGLAPSLRGPACCECVAAQMPSRKSRCTVLGCLVPDVGPVCTLDEVRPGLLRPPVEGLKDAFLWTSEACSDAVSYTHLRAHETRHDLVC